MDVASPDARHRLFDRLAPILARLGEQAYDCDRSSSLPSDLGAALHAADALAAPLPAHLGGLGLGTDGHCAHDTHELLYRIGAASLPLGRVYEGHLNALRLIILYGTRDQAAEAAADARAGHMFAVWIAEDPTRPVRRTRAVLDGWKTFASGTDAITRALVTVQEHGERMALVVAPQDGWRVGQRPDLHGMRGTGTASVDLTGLPVPARSLIGGIGDYMREPEISLGAWRPLAVLSGGLSALSETVRAELIARGREDHPQQRARLAALLAAAETARLWSRRAARLADFDGNDDAAAYVKLARMTVESACATAITLAQRSVGLAAFVRSHPIERLCRDLATYMRQPALDEVIDEAASHFIEHTPPR